ncbi:MAG: glycosyltransferase family 2 protein [Planctomycetaceae bacterium]|nr:glycosyltransferase family 2 protein [Planctomycetaceae bacterium]
MQPPHTERTLFQSFVSLVLPVYNEVQVLEQLELAIRRVMQELDCRYEVIFVNDGSTDGSEQLLDELAEKHRPVRVVHLSRNFGHQAALQAGLSHSRGDATIVMDSDFQDDPTAISTFLDLWEHGYDVIYAVRTKRKEGALKRMLFSGFYHVLNRISRTHIPRDAGNFGLIDRRVMEVLLRLSDTDRFFPGLRSWVGYRQIGVEVERLPRHDENPRVSFWGLCRLAKTAIFSFSRVPLTMFYVIALVSCLVCLGLTSFTLYQKLIVHEATPGWASSLMTASFFGSLNSLGVAILGEYVVRIYDQVRARPQFLVDRTTNLSRLVKEPNPSHSGDHRYVSETVSNMTT